MKIKSKKSRRHAMSLLRQRPAGDKNRHQPRRLATEQLEDRMMLAADISPWQNVLRPTDVNGDGRASALDAFIVIDQLRRGGPRSLALPLASGGEGEGGTATRMFVDVNGDKILSSLDVFTIIGRLRNGEGEAALARFIVEASTSPFGASLTNFGIGGNLFLNAYVEDLRMADPNPATPQDDRGLASAFMDVTFAGSGGVTQVPGMNTLCRDTGDLPLTITFGTNYNDPNPNNNPDIKNACFQAPNRINDTGSIQTGIFNDPFLPPVGPGRQPLFSVQFDATMLGQVTFTSELPRQDVFFASPPLPKLTANDIMFGATTINIVQPVQAIDDAFTVVEDSNPSVNAANRFDVLANDVVTTPTGQKTIKPGSITMPSQGGTATINDNATPTNPTDDFIDYQPAPDFFGTETFTYVLTDGINPLLDSMGTVTVTVSETNDAPTATNDTKTTQLDNVLVFPSSDLLLNDNVGPANERVVTAGRPAQTLRVTGVGTNTGSVPGSTATTTLNGTVAFDSVTREITYTPPIGVSGIDTFAYEIIDDGTTAGVADPKTARATVTVTISDFSKLVEISLEARDASNALITTIGNNEQFQLVVNVSDLRPIAAGEDRGVLQAFLNLLYDNSRLMPLMATPPPFNFQITFGPDFDSPVFAGDRAGATDTGSVIQDVGSVEDNAFDQSIPPLGSGKFELFRIPFETKALTGSAVFTTQAATDPFKEISITAPPPEFAQIVPPVQVEFRPFSIDVVVKSANTPVANPDSYSVDEDQTLVITDANAVAPNGGVLGNDTDADFSPPSNFVRGVDVKAILVSPPANRDTSAANGGFVLNADGTFTYKPLPNFNGTDTFTYRANDGGNNSNVVTVTITVNPVNDAPVAVDDPSPTTRYAAGVFPATLNVTAVNGVLRNDTDVDMDTLTVTVADRGTRITSQNGTVNLFADGRFDYTPPANFTGTDTFTYRAFDGTVDSNVATVRIDVGVTPRTISGFVYFDGNNNGVKDPLERPIGGVEIRLDGRDSFNNPVQEITRTGADGRYRFDMVTLRDPVTSLPVLNAMGQPIRVTLRPGSSYTVREIQPAFIIDGFESSPVEGAKIAGSNLAGNIKNDQFNVSLVNVLDAVDFNFGEIGMLPNFYSVQDYLASTVKEGVNFAFDNVGNLVWYSLELNGWTRFSSLSAQFLNNRTQLQIIGTEASGNRFQATISTVNNPRFRTLGAVSTGTAVKLEGKSSDFTFVLIP
jgi:hypothetical protein